MSRLRSARVVSAWKQPVLHPLLLPNLAAGIMNRTTLGLIAAMPEEIAPLLRISESCRREKAGTFRLYRLRFGSIDACLVESGMGPAHAAEATSRLIEECRPGIILNFGFAGAISPELKVGDIVIANRLLFYHEGLFSEQQGGKPLSEIVGNSLHRGTFVTTSRITDKKLLAQRLPSGVSKAVVEMETAAAAKMAWKAGIPFLAIRAISDASDEDLDFTLDEFCDSDLKLRLWRVLYTVARKPRIIPQLVRLARNAKTAGNNLTAFLHENIEKIVHS